MSAATTPAAAPADIGAELERLAVREGDVKTRAGSAFDGAAREWLQSYIHDSPIAASTAAWNHLLATLPKLRETLLRSL